MTLRMVRVVVVMVVVLATSTKARIDHKTLGGPSPRPPTHSRKLDTRKCCLMGELKVEYGLGHGQRKCEKLGGKLGRSGIDPTRWQERSLGQFAIHHGAPACGEGEDLVPLYHHTNTQGFSHQLELREDGVLLYNSTAGKTMTFGDEKYCVDTLWMAHNYSHYSNEATLVNFTYVCLDLTQSVEEVVETVVYPVGVAVSMACLTLTFLLYTILPQLRDLTGKFILGLCSFLTCNYALRLIDAEMLGFNDPNLEDLALEVLGHGCVLGAWLCLNCMGHHVWKVIQSKSVFTRVTDGQRCCYYSMYVTISTAGLTCMALVAHLLTDDEGLGSNHLGVVGLGLFYVPVAVLLLVNLYFYATSNRQIGKQLVYNRNMQHFQVNFDLFTKLFLVVGVCSMFQTLALLDIRALEYIGKIFVLLQGPLIFVVAMCRTRVAFLFKRYFCQDSCLPHCCRGDSEFIELPAEELTTIDKAREAMEKEEEEGVGRSLLDRWGDSAAPANREMSKSLFNVRSRPDGEDREAPQTPLMRVVGMLKASSLANLNFGWRKETSV